MTGLIVILMAAASLAAGAGEELVPYTPKQKPRRRTPPGAVQAPPSEDQLRGEREAAAFHIKALAAADQLRKDALYRYVEIEDILLEPSAWTGRAVGFLGFANSIKIATDKPSGSFTGGHTIFHLTASFAGLPAGKRKELLAAQDGTDRHLLAVKGVVRSASGAPFLDTQEFLDLGATPRWSPQEVARILESPEVNPNWNLSDAEPAAETVARLKRDRRALYLAVEDLLIEPSRYEGRTVQVVGATWGLNVGDSVPSLRLSNRFAAGDFIQATLAGLPRRELKDLMRRSAGSAFLAVKGRVKQAPNGIPYLDASRAEWLGYWGSVGEFADRKPAIGRGRFRRTAGTVTYGKGAAGPGGFEDRDAAMSAYRAKMVAALEEGKRYPAHELVEIEDLLVSPRGYAGRRVKLLGAPWGCQDGAVGRFCSVGNGFTSGGGFPVRLQSLSEAKRKEAAAWDVLGGMALLVMSVYEEQGRIFGRLEDFVDVGKHPPGQLARPDEVLSFTPGKRHPTKEDVRDRIQAAVEEAKAERGRRYIRFEDLIVEPGPLLDKPVALAGVMQRIEVGGGRPYFKLVVAWVGSDEIAVSIGRLSHEEQKRLLRLSFPPHALLVRATVRAASNGAIYLDAESVADCGPDSGDALKEAR